MQINNNFQTNKETERTNKSNRLENQKIEQDLENKRKIILNKIREKKVERINMIQKISSIDKEIKDINLDLEIISTYGREGQLEKNNQLNHENEICKSPKRKSIFIKKINQSEEKKPKLVNIFKVQKI